MLNLGRDLNGNKILKYIGVKGSVGFSVQTNGNLPETHKMININHRVALVELCAYINKCGTDRQRNLFRRVGI